MRMTGSQVSTTDAESKLVGVEGWKNRREVKPQLSSRTTDAEVKLGWKEFKVQSRILTF